ncbi:MAG TPA: sugar ABC transporter permease [Steroidobacteraceae bacterium]|nr:sugar ABC transporter permease [Steroidobacteraceae bacterium]
MKSLLGRTHLALLPMAFTALVCYLGATLWSIRISLSSSHTFPVEDFVGLAQYRRLFANERWLHSLQNLGVYGALFVFASLLLGFLLAVLIEREVRLAGGLRLVFLYPYAMSFIATGLAWQWLLNPQFGIQEVVRRWGYPQFRFDWLVDQDRALYTIVIATVWQAAGLVMAILLAGLRGIDPDIWNAARLEGIPAWRLYASVIVPMLAAPFATAALLLLTAVAKLYDAVVAMTQGGPGTASEVPAKFIMDHLFGRANIAQASAGATVLVLSALLVLAPVLYARARAARVRA